jgi:hypothetical protein
MEEEKIDARNLSARNLHEGTYINTTKQAPFGNGLNLRKNIFPQKYDPSSRNSLNNGGLGKRGEYIFLPSSIKCGSVRKYLNRGKSSVKRRAKKNGLGENGTDKKQKDQTVQGNKRGFKQIADWRGRKMPFFQWKKKLCELCLKLIL